MERTRASSWGSETTIGFGERVRAPAKLRALSPHTHVLSSHSNTQAWTPTAAAQTSAPPRAAAVARTWTW